MSQFEYPETQIPSTLLSVQPQETRSAACLCPEIKLIPDGLLSADGWDKNFYSSRLPIDNGTISPFVVVCREGLETLLLRQPEPMNTLRALGAWLWFTRFSRKEAIERIVHYFDSSLATLRDRYMNCEQEPGVCMNKFCGEVTYVDTESTVNRCYACNQPSVDSMTSIVWRPQ